MPDHAHHFGIGQFCAAAACLVWDHGVVFSQQLQVTFLPPSVTPLALSSSMAMRAPFSLFFAQVGNRAAGGANMADFHHRGVSSRLRVLLQRCRLFSFFTQAASRTTTAHRLSALTVMCINFSRKKGNPRM